MAVGCAARSISRPADGVPGSIGAETLAVWVLEPPRPKDPGPRTASEKVTAVGNLGTSVANRNSNPLNLKLGSKTRHYVDLGVATISEIVPTDGGRFLKFDDPETGFRAASELLNAYGDLELDGALRKWSNAGYDGAILAGTSLDSQTAVSDLRRADLSVLLHAMAAAEGYRSSTIGDEIRNALRR